MADTWDIVGPLLLTVFVFMGAIAFGSKIPNAVGYLNILVLYIPISLMIAGFIPDIVTQEFNYSVVSITGIIGAILNRIASTLVMSFLTGPPEKLRAAVATLPSDIGTLNKGINPLVAKYHAAFSGCTVPGFEFLESTLAPQSLVMLTSMYFFLLIVFIHDEHASIVGLSSAFVILFALQMVSSIRNGCFNSEFFVFGPGWLSVAGILGSLLVISAISAGFGYLIKKSIPSSTGGTTNTYTLSPNGRGKMSSVNSIPTKDVGVSDQDQFVCDAYKNGELVTSTVVE
jgi:hypothetical protein